MLRVILASCAIVLGEVVNVDEPLCPLTSFLRDLGSGEFASVNVAYLKSAVVR